MWTLLFEENGSSFEKGSLENIWTQWNRQISVYAAYKISQEKSVKWKIQGLKLEDFEIRDNLLYINGK